MFASEASKEAAEELVLPQQTRLQNVVSPACSSPRRGEHAAGMQAGLPGGQLRPSPRVKYAETSCWPGCLGTFSGLCFKEAIGAFRGKARSPGGGYVTRPPSSTVRSTRPVIQEALFL